MAKLPILSGNEAVKAFNKEGWFVKRQTGIINVKAGSKVTIFIPRHKERDWSSFGKLIMFAGLPVKKIHCVMIIDGMYRIREALRFEGCLRTRHTMAGASAKRNI